MAFLVVVNNEIFLVSGFILVSTFPSSATSVYTISNILNPFHHLNRPFFSLSLSRNSILLPFIVSHSYFAPMVLLFYCFALPFHSHGIALLLFCIAISLPWHCSFIVSNFNFTPLALLFHCLAFPFYSLLLFRISISLQWHYSFIVSHFYFTPLVLVFHCVALPVYYHDIALLWLCPLIFIVSHMHFTSVAPLLRLV